jgi:hypothetical protein
MTDTDDAIPDGMISTRDAFEILYQTITPNRQTLEERLDPNSPYYDAFKGAKKSAKKSATKGGRKRLKKGLEKDPEKNPKEDARREAWRNLDQAELNASKRLRKKLSQGTIVVLFGKKRKTAEKISRDRWASMSDFEAMLIFLEGKLIVRRKRRILYLDPENFIKEIAPPDGDRAAQPGERAPAASKDRPDHQQKVLDIYQQIWPDGYNGRAKKRDEAIMNEFQRRHKDQVSVRTIQRALKSLKAD